MKHSQMRKRRVIAALLTTCFLFQQSMIVPTMATEIGGAGDWVTGVNGVYDINPTSKNGTMGFRQYEKFNLSAGDIANLIFRYGTSERGNIDTFVNLVDSKININGIVNAMRDGNFFNGKAIFVSPNGMVVGASGVLNVGSLSVLTPTADDYNSFKTNVTPSRMDLLNSEGGASVQVNGKILAQNNVDINAGVFVTGQDSSIVAGASDMTQIVSKSQATALFKELVNTNNVTSGAKLTSNDGSIVIKSYGTSGIGTNILGSINNLGTGNVDITNSGNALKVGSTGSVSGAGTVNLSNTGAGGTSIAGLLAANTLNVTNSNGGVVISGTANASENTNITNIGNGGVSIAVAGAAKAGNGVIISNTGDGGVSVAGNVNGDTVNINNNAGGITVSGVVNGATKATLTNSGANGVKVQGTVSGKNIAIDNSADGILIASAGKVNGTGAVNITNTGANGTKIQGKVSGNGVTLTNKNSDIIIGSSANDQFVTSSGLLTINLENGDLLSSGDTGVKTHLVTTNGGNLSINVKGGSIGEQVGKGCQGAACTQERCRSTQEQ